MNDGRSIRWLFLPPFVALFIAAAAIFLSSSPSEPVDPAWWGLTGLLFLVLTVLYGLFVVQNFTAGLVPVQMVAQGLLLGPLSLSLGARMLQWVGVTMAVCGATVLVAVYCKHRKELLLRAVTQMAGSDERSLPLPFVVTNGEGDVLSVSDALLALARVTREDALLGKVTLFLRPGDETTTLGGRTWLVRQTPMQDGRFYFQLDERSAPEPRPAAPDGAEAFVEPVTQFFTRAYAFRRVDEELYRVRRYQRFLSAVLLRFEFAPSGSPDDEDAFFVSYCRLLRANTRATDIACLVGPRDVFLVLPETSQETAEGTIGKVLELLPSLSGRFGAVGVPGVADKIVFVGAGLEMPDAYALLKLLDEGLGAR